jgi:hypothetical protein
MSMKRLVILGEGHGEVAALPILVKRLLREKQSQDILFVDAAIIRTNPSRLVKWNAGTAKPDFSQWNARIELAARRPNIGGVLAIYDGDAKHFPAGSPSPFCACNAAKAMAGAAATAGAGKIFSLSVVFACSEYETWLIAGVESLAGCRFPDGRLAVNAGVTFPRGDPESHGKGWLEQNSPSYLPTRDQHALTELIDFQFVRAKGLRSFKRLENALDQLVRGVRTGSHVVTPF